MSDALKYIRRIQGTSEEGFEKKLSEGQNKIIQMLDYVMNEQLNIDGKGISIYVNNKEYKVSFSKVNGFGNSRRDFDIYVKVIGGDKNIILKVCKEENKFYSSDVFDSPYDINYTIVEPINHGEVITMINQYNLIYDRYYHPRSSNATYEYVYAGQGSFKRYDLGNEDNGIEVRKKKDGTIIIEENSSLLGNLGEYSKKPNTNYITITKGETTYYYDIKTKKISKHKSEPKDESAEDILTADNGVHYHKKKSNLYKILDLFDEEIKWTNFSEEELVTISEEITKKLVKLEGEVQQSKKYINNKIN